MVFIISVIGIHAQEYSNNFAPIDLDKEMIKTHPRVIVNDFEPIRKRLKTDLIMQVWFESLQNDPRMDTLAMNYILSGNESIAKIAYKKALDHDVKEMVRKGHHHYDQSLVKLASVYDWLYHYMRSHQLDGFGQ